MNEYVKQQKLYNKRYINQYTLLAKKKSPIRFPRLDTVLMVEEHIRNHSGEFKKKALWNSLPKGMMYQTFCVVFDYLLESRKIALDKHKVVGWIWDPKGVDKYLSNTNLFWEK